MNPTWTYSVPTSSIFIFYEAMGLQGLGFWRLGFELEGL